MSLETILEIVGKEVKESYKILQNTLLALKNKDINEVYKTPKDLEEKMLDGNYLTFLEIAGKAAIEGDIGAFNHYISASMHSISQYIIKNQGKIDEEDQRYMESISMLATNIKASFYYIREVNGLDNSMFDYNFSNN